MMSKAPPGAAGTMIRIRPVRISLGVGAAGQRRQVVADGLQDDDDQPRLRANRVRPWRACPWSSFMNLEGWVPRCRAINSVNN